MKNPLNALTSAFVLSVISLFSVAATHSAEAAGFCWAQVPSGVNCTVITNSTPITFGFTCTAWAHSQSASKWGSYRNADINVVLAQQIEACNYVNGQNKYECFITETCPTTSSLRPTHKALFAPDMTAAVSGCVDVAAVEYLAALRTVGAGCGISPKAVATMP